MISWGVKKYSVISVYEIIAYVEHIKNLTKVYTQSSRYTNNVSPERLPK